MAGELFTTVNFLAPVQDQIQRVETLMRSQADDRHPDLDAALQHLLSSGGKRVRPAEDSKCCRDRKSTRLNSSHT